MRRLILVSTTLGVGGALAAGVFWALLNVPESSGLALVLSGVLSLLVLLVVSASLGAGSSVAHGHGWGSSGRRLLAALPAGLLGIACFAVCWLVANWLAGVWQQRSSEVDATLMRFVGVSDAWPVHAAVRGLAWCIRWALGVALLVALPCAAVAGGLAAVGRGVGQAFRPTRLIVAALAVAFVEQAVWPSTNWRPSMLPASSVEVLFAGAKLAALYAAGVVALALVVLVNSSAPPRQQ